MKNDIEITALINGRDYKKIKKNMKSTYNVF